MSFWGLFTGRSHLRVSITKTTRFGSPCPAFLQAVLSQLCCAGTLFSMVCQPCPRVSAFQLSPCSVPCTWEPRTHELAWFLLFFISAFTILDVILVYNPNMRWYVALVCAKEYFVFWKGIKVCWKDVMVKNTASSKQQTSKRPLLFLRFCTSESS